jgi:hypothetical protein
MKPARDEHRKPEAVRAVGLGVAEQRFLPPAERVVGHGDRNRDGRRGVDRGAPGRRAVERRHLPPALVELDDGPRTYGRIAGVPEQFVLDARVRAVFYDLAPGVTLVGWAPADS